MNVTELARKLKLTTNELLDKLPELGFDIGRRAIKIDANLVDKIIKAVEEDKRKKRLASEEVKIKEIKLDQQMAEADELSAKPVVKIPEVIIVKDLAEKMNLPVARLIAELMKNGVMASLNERIDFETASIITEDLGFTAEKLSDEESQAQVSGASVRKLKEIIKARGESGNLQSRPPVIVVMGHVDHGKTKLLDAIRETNIIEGEFGGITQHIGAYQAIKDDRLITFLDTPGHEAFKSMRSRGSKIADIAIIVVAADDGLKPQTLEVIDLIQKENLPFVVAINKVDKEEADVDRVKKELSEINLIPEDWGGKTICVPISAKQKTGLKELLDMVLLVTDMEDFKADPDGPAAGTIIEAHVDKGEGPVATVLVQSGTLKAGDLIVVGSVAGKIRALKDFLGKEVSEARPSMPVKILGLKSAPIVGDILEVTTDRKMIKQLIKTSDYQRQQTMQNVKQAEQKEDDKKEKVPSLNLIIKTDVLGSQEAILEALGRFVDPNVKLKIIKKGLGHVTDVDVFDANSTGSAVIAYNVKTVGSADELAREKGVEILKFNIIYKFLEEVEKRLQALLKPEIVRTELGTIKVLAVFTTDKAVMIVGGKVMEGTVKSKTKVKVIRNDEVLDMGNLLELRSGKEVVNEVNEGEECGLKYQGKVIIEVGDMLEIYQEEEKVRKLLKKETGFK